MDWYSSETDEVLDNLDSSEDGLNQDEVEERFEEYGKNEISSEDDFSPFKIFLSQFQDFLIYLLIAAAVISVGVSMLQGHAEFGDAALIMVILLANGILGFIQDYRAEKSISALKEMSNPNAVVLRDGEKREIDSKNIVPGDIVFIEQGDAIPADARIIESHSLETSEASLTGESANVSKSEEALDDETPLAERKNMLYKNTTAVKGRGKAVVVSTGMETEVGNIAQEIEDADDKETPFQKEVDELGKKIGKGIMVIIALVAVTQFTTAYIGPSELTLPVIVSVLMVAITLAVAAVPEGLPAVVTLTLTMGSKKMLKKNALVRSLPVVESLGSVDAIVTDKTGTLTEGVMTVKKLYYQGEEIEVTGTGTSTKGKFMKDGHEVETEYLEPLLETGFICNNSEKTSDGFTGDPTEIALNVSALKADISPEKERKDEIPFSSDRKRMSVVTDDGIYMKGAPEVVLERCDRILKDGEVKNLTEEMREDIIEENTRLAEEALRVLGFAHKDDTTGSDDEEIESGLVFLGLQGMIDPPRKEVREAVDDCRDAGIDVVMATGDNIETAKAIGKQIGFSPENGLTGPEIEKMSDEELGDKVENTEIFARVSPDHKVRILEALQNKGKNVAMTGDGVNDAPALKNSDVGVSMGQRGTDVAQQASDMVLRDDNFATIRDAIAEGRGIFDNIRKFVNYLLSANAGEVLVVFLGILIGSFMFPEQFQSAKGVILTPVMLLWLNLVTDGLPAIALGVDPKSEGIMKRPPRGADEPVINKRIMASIIGIGIVMALAGLPVFFYALKTSGILMAQTVLFTLLVLMEIVRIQLIRSRYNLKITSNKWLVGALASSVLLQLTVLYTPASNFFEVATLGRPEWLVMGAGLLGFVGMSYIFKELLDSHNRYINRL